MQEWQERVVEENEELKGKIGRLTDFIHSTSLHEVDKAEQGRMMKQLDTMEEYHRILEARITNFE